MSEKRKGGWIMVGGKGGVFCVWMITVTWSAGIYPSIEVSVLE